MSLKLRRKLITFLTAFVLLFASLAVFVAPNNFVNVNAQVIEAQIVGVQDNYIVNAKVTFPVSISDPISAEDGVIIYPNGKVYKLVEGKEFTLSLAGDYTLRYFGANQVVEKSFRASQKNFVLSTDQEIAGRNEIVAATTEMMAGQMLPSAGAYPEDYAFEKYDNNTAWPNIEQNLTTLGNEALIVRMEAGTKFTYSVPIDISKAEEDGLTNIIKFHPLWGNYDRSKPNSSANYIKDIVARTITITLTDCYDSSRYLRFIVQQGGDTNYARSGTDNMVEAGWVFPTSRVPTSDMSYRDFYEGTEYGFAYVGQYGCTPAGNLNEWVRRDGIYFKFDNENAKVYATSFDTNGKTGYQETMITDFMNKSVYPTTDYRGFTTGEVYLSIEFSDYQASSAARVDIYEIAGIPASQLIQMRNNDVAGNPSNMFKDEKAPVIDVDFKPTVSDGVYVDVGTNFVVPTANVYDVNLKGDMKVMAYRNYSDPAHKINVPIINGKVNIAEEDIYTIVYYAEDAYGNATEKVVKVFGVKDESNPAIFFDYGTELSNLDAGRTYTLPKFEFNTKNDANSRKLKITISSDRESFVVANLVGSLAIEEFLAKDVDIKLSYSGEYTIEYAYADNAISGVESYTFISNASDVRSFADTPVLPRYLIKDATYDFDEIYVYSYITGSQQPHSPAEVYIAYDADINLADLSLSNFTKLDSVFSNKITGSEKAVLKYVCGEDALYTDVATIIDTNIANLGKLEQYKYFVGDFATANITDPTYDADLFPEEVYRPIIGGKPTFTNSVLDYKSKVMSGDNTLSFLNIIDLSNFAFYFRIIADSDSRVDADNYNGLKLVFTDPYNPNNTAYVRIYKLEDGTTVFVDLNGQSSMRVNQSFSGSIDKYFTYNLSTKLFAISGLSTRLPFTFDFTTNRAYLDIVLEDISGVAGIRILELNGHKFAHDGRARTTPTTLMTIPQGNYASGSVITINAAEFIDVLSPIVKEKVSLSVKGPDEVPLTALDGTVLDGTCDPYKSYQVRLEDMGQYTISYSAQSGINQKTQPPGFVFVVDSTAPVITYTGDVYEGCVLYLKPGQKYTLKYTLSDDVTLPENIYALIIWTNAYNCNAGTFFDNVIYFIHEGVYEVGVSCTDDQNNFARKTFTVVVTSEEVK